MINHKLLLELLLFIEASKKKKILILLELALGQIAHSFLHDPTFTLSKNSMKPVDYDVIYV